MTQSYKSARRLDSKANILEVRKYIQEFYADNGKYPADLTELQGFNGITLKSDRYVYEPASGTLVEKPEYCILSGVSNISYVKNDLTRSYKR